MPKDTRKRIQERTDALSERIYENMRNRTYARIAAEEINLDEGYRRKAKRLRTKLRGLTIHTDAEVKKALLETWAEDGEERVAIVRRMIEAGAKEGAVAGKELFETMFGKEGPPEERPFAEQLSSELRPKLRPLRLLGSAGKRRSTD